MFLKYLQPDYEFPCAADIDVDILLAHNTIIWDVDNTLVIPETELLLPGVENLFKKIQGLTHICVSNSPTIQKRVHCLQKIGCVVYTGKYFKPFASLYRDLNKKFKLKNNILFIGDRLFIDVYFAKRYGWTSILIKPLSQNEWVIIKIIRYIENALLKLLK